MKTSSADVRSRVAKSYFFVLPVTLLAAALASWMEIEPRFEAGVITKRPVAALRPRTVLPCLPVLLLAASERVAMVVMCAIHRLPARSRDWSRDLKRRAAGCSQHLIQAVGLFT